MTSKEKLLITGFILFILGYFIAWPMYEAWKQDLANSVGHKIAQQPTEIQLLKVSTARAKE